MLSNRIDAANWTTLAVAWYVGYLVLLVSVPYLVPMPPNVASAAALAGYSTSAAFYTAVLWSAGGIVLFALIGRPGGRDDPPTTAPTVEAPGTVVGGRRPVIEIAIVVALVALLYFPPFLAKSGPFIEDSSILTILHRMHGGQTPYADFVFLYSPLMIYPAHLWMKLFGYSMSAYYAYLAVLLALQFGLLLAVLQRFIARPARRYVVFLLISAFLVETLLGINWIGLRRLLPVLALLLVATRPRAVASTVGAGAILGCAMAYSHDYGAAGLLAAGAVYAVGLLSGDVRATARAGLTVALVAVAVWFGISIALLGGAFPNYLRTASALVERYAAGEAGFRFYWTVNAMAVFALVWVACLCVATGLRGHREGRRLAAGDRMLLGGLAYGFVLFRMGLNRSDFWHLDPVIIGLLFAFLLPLQFELFHISALQRRLAHLFIAIGAATYLVGSAPTGSYYLGGYLKGMRQTIRPAGGVPAQPFATPAPALLWEGGAAPSADAVALTELLARRWAEGSRVLFYGETWVVGKMVGIYKTDPLPDDMLSSDESGDRLRAYLEEDPRTLIVMMRPGFDRLFGHADPDALPDYDWYQGTATKRLAAWVASVHYLGIPLERRAIEGRLERTVAPFIRAHYTELASFGDIIVLHREDQS